MGEPPRPEPRPGARQLLAVLAALVFLAGLFASLRIDRAPAVAAPAPCDPVAVMHARLDELGRDGFDWIITWNALGNDRGRADIDNRIVRIRPTVGCDYMASVVTHEWFHVQQAHRHGDDLNATHDAYGAELELVADCGSMLLGSPKHPYVDQAGGCTPYQRAAARQLVAESHAADKIKKAVR